jgi:excisionase family DNA binding protein
MSRPTTAAGTRRFIGVADVADRYGVTRSTVYEWIRRGAIPYRKLPGRKMVLFSIADLDVFDDGNCELEVRRVKGGRIVRPVRPR